MLANIPQQDLTSGFDQNYLQIVIPRHMNHMISYIYHGHNLKIYQNDGIVDIRENITNMQLGMKFQTPLFKYFFPSESDVVSGLNFG